MTINLTIPDIREMRPRITVFGVGGAGGNAVNNMITAGLQGVDFVVANTDAQALTMSKAERIIQMGVQVTEGLGAGSQPDVGRAAAEEVIDEIRDHLTGAHMVFVTAGMGGGTVIMSRSSELPAITLPCSVLIRSASKIRALSPRATSMVTLAPPSAKPSAWMKRPAENTAMVVVPAPMSTKAAPMSASSSASTDSPAT